jgi:hypothetical protein
MVVENCTRFHVYICNIEIFLFDLMCNKVEHTQM